MSLNRAYAVLDVKASAADDGQRTISGWATTPRADRSNDIINPLGVKFANPLPLLWMHNSDEPIGTAIFGTPTAKGIPFTAQIATFEDPPGLKARVDEAWNSIRAKLVRGVSIGFRAIKYSYLDNGGVEYDETEVVELSCVTIPCNSDATISTIKSFDLKQGASAHKVVRLPPPGVTGKSAAAIVRVATKTPPEGTMNVQKQIESWTAARQAKSAVIASLLEATEKSGESMDDKQSEEYESAKAEIATIDKHLQRLNESAALLAGTAVRLPAASADGETAEQIAQKQTQLAAVPGGHSRVIAVEKKLDKGIAFARFAKTMVMAGGNARDAFEIAKERYPNEIPLHNIIKMHIGQGRSSQFIEKAAVDAALTTNSAWAGALVQYQDMANDFIEFLRPQTILGRIPGLRMVPFKVRVPRQTGGGAAYWVGQGAGKPLTSLAFDNVTLDFTKIATIAVLTDEIVRLSSPSAEAITRDQLAGAIIQQMDADFIDPDNAGTANVKPASITNGVVGIASSGNAEANVRQDILAVFQPWIVNNVTPVNAVWIMSATTALALSLMVNGLGQPSFPGLTMNGGQFFGLPVIVSESAGVVNGSAGGHIVVLLNARDIMVADDGTVAVDASREASLEMSDAPANNSGTATGASLVSMFQTNSVAIRAERWVNWVKARSTAVQFLKSVNWGEA